MTYHKAGAINHAPAPLFLILSILKILLILSIFFSSFGLFSFVSRVSRFFSIGCLFTTDTADDGGLRRAGRLNRALQEL